MLLTVGREADGEPCRRYEACVDEGGGTASCGRVGARECNFRAARVVETSPSRVDERGGWASGRTCVCVRAYVR